MEWDKKKNQINYEKHGLDFEDAELILSGKTITFQDKRFNYGEEIYFQRLKKNRHND